MDVRSIADDIRRPQVGDDDELPVDAADQLWAPVAQRFVKMPLWVKPERLKLRCAA
jgi:hypothetical protein